MYDSPEFSPFNKAPLGVPGNPLDGTPGLEEIKRKRPEKGTRAPLAVPGRLSFQEMVDVGTPPRGVPVAQEPHQLLVPDVVSATDPAYSQHPFVKHVFNGLGKIPAADTGSTSPWTQWKSKGRGMTNSGLKKALQVPGIDLPYQQQGAMSGT
jgi:hypothetical protein